MGIELADVPGDRLWGPNRGLGLPILRSISWNRPQRRYYPKFGECLFAIRFRKGAACDGDGSIAHYFRDFWWGGMGGADNHKSAPTAPPLRTLIGANDYPFFAPFPSIVRSPRIILNPADPYPR